MIIKTTIILTCLVYVIYAASINNDKKEPTSQAIPPPALDLNEDPKLLESMLSMLRSASLDHYIVRDSAGHEKVDTRSLFYDPKSLPVMVEFLHQHGYPTPSLFAPATADGPILAVNSNSAKRYKQRNLFASIGTFFTSLFDSVVSTMQENVMAGMQGLVSGSVKQVLGQIEQTLFLGTPLNFNQIVTAFIADIKESIRNAIVTSVESAFQQQALRLLDMQASELNKLLDSLKSNSLSPIQFISSLQNVIDSINSSLKAFVPSVSDIIGMQLKTLLTQVLNSVPPKIYE